MYVKDGTPFIQLFIAGNCLRIADDQQRPVVIYTDKLLKDLHNYFFCSGMYDIFDSETKQLLITKKLKGFGKIKLSPPPDIFEQRIKWNDQFSAIATVCCFTEGVPNGYEEHLINFEIDDIFRKNYLHQIFINVDEYFSYVEKIGFEINSNFLENLMLDDSSFCEQVRLTRLTPDKKISYRQLASKYLKRLTKISDETIIKAAKQASDTYLSLKRRQFHKRGDVIADNIFDIGELISEVPITNVNLVNLKDSLPYEWQKALFNQEKYLKKEKLDASLIERPSIRELNNLYKTIGVLTKALVDNKGNVLGDKHKPNISQVSHELSKYLPDDTCGLSDRSIRDRIRKGLQAIED